MSNSDNEGHSAPGGQWLGMSIKVRVKQEEADAQKKINTSQRDR